MRHAPPRVPWVLCATALVAVPATTEEDGPRRPCFSNAMPDVASIAITRDARYAGAGDLEKFHVLASGLAPTGFMKFSFRPVHMAPHPSLPQFAVAAGNVRLVEMATRKTIADFKPASWFVAWRRGGAELLGIDYDKTVHIWDVATRKELAKWKLPLDKKKSSRFEDYSDAGGLLALGFDDGMVRVFDAASGREVASIAAHPVDGETRMTGMALSPDGRLLATCDHGQVKVWDVSNGAMKRRFSSRPGGLASFVRFYAKGTRLAFANYVDPGYGFDFIDAESGTRIARGLVTAHASVESWDMAFPESEEPTIVFVADETVYLCPYGPLTGRGPGIKVIGSPPP